jgi:hypothetical protein
MKFFAMITSLCVMCLVTALLWYGYRNGQYMMQLQTARQETRATAQVERAADEQERTLSQYATLTALALEAEQQGYTKMNAPLRIQPQVAQLP